jgi:hypothetical protein
MRVHEADVGLPNPNYRFQIVNYEGLTHQETIQKTTNGTNTFVEKVYKRATTIGLFARVANTYYTVNSAVKEMIWWHPSINLYFDAPYGNVFKVNSSLAVQGAFALPANREIHLHPEDYLTGSVARHELGHVVQWIIHGGNRNGKCGSYWLGNVDGHGYNSCEWGVSAMDEAVANFFAARSITGNDNAFICGCRDVYYPAHCSDAAALILLGDPEQDGVGSCTNGALAGIGDVWFSSGFSGFIS